MYPSMRPQRLPIFSDSDLPRESGKIVNVFDMPSFASLNGSFATEHREASAPFVSRPWNGFAPGAKGIPAILPSGVLPVFFP